MLNDVNIEELVDNRPFEPDYPGQRNPWDAKRHPKNHYYVKAIIDQIDLENNRPIKYPSEIKEKVYELRAQGWTLRRIADEVKISKSTCCLYLQKQKTALVYQPGTTKSVETNYTVREVNIGKIKSQ